MIVGKGCLRGCLGLLVLLTSVVCLQAQDIRSQEAPAVFKEVGVTIYFDYSDSFVGNHKEDLDTFNRNVKNLLVAMFGQGLSNVRIFYFDGRVTTNPRELNSERALDDFTHFQIPKSERGGNATNLIEVFQKIGNETSFKQIVFVISDFVHEEVNCFKQLNVSECLEENQSLFMEYLANAEGSLSDTMIFLVPYSWAPNNIPGRLLRSVPLSANIEYALGEKGFTKLLRPEDLQYGQFLSEYRKLERKKIEILGAYYTNGSQEQVSLVLSGSGLTASQILGFRVRSGDRNQIELPRGSYTLVSEGLPAGDALVLIDQPGALNLEGGKMVSIEVTYGDSVKSRWTEPVMLIPTGYHMDYNKVTLLPKFSGNDFGFQLRIKRLGSASVQLRGELLDGNRVVGELARQGSSNPVLLWSVLDPTVFGIDRNSATRLGYRLVNQDNHVLRMGSFEQSHTYDFFIDFSLRWALVTTFILLLYISMTDRMKGKFPRHFWEVLQALLPTVGALWTCTPSLLFSLINVYFVANNYWQIPSSRLTLHGFLCAGASTVIGLVFWVINRGIARRSFERRDWRVVTRHTTPEIYADALTFRAKMATIGLTLIVFVCSLLLLSPFI